MAPTRICSIPNCGKKASAKELCLMHYTRLLRHGDTQKRIVQRGEAQKFLHDVAVPFRGHECLFWPFAKTKGYGWIRHHGKGCYVHRVVCEIVHGVPPAADSVTRHLCGNGHLSCCNPKHLAWGTLKENSEDCLAHGTMALGERQGSSKLTSDQVLEIRSLGLTVTAQSLADKFGVSKSQIDRIRSGQRWAWLKPQPNT